MIAHGFLVGWPYTFALIFCQVITHFTLINFAKSCPRKIQYFFLTLATVVATPVCPTLCEAE